VVDSVGDLARRHERGGPAEQATPEFQKLVVDVDVAQTARGR